MGKEYYNTKVIETVDFVEMWLYIDDRIMYNHGDKNNQDKLDNFDYSSKENISKQDIKTSTHYEKLKRLQRYYENMRWELSRLIDCNFDDKTKFMTLAFKENIQDIDFSNNEFTNFIRRLNYKLYGVKKAMLKYIAVWEKQKRGAIHYHIIFFDFPFSYLKSVPSVLSL